MNNAIETALGQRLAALPNIPPVAWPNANYDPKTQGAVPYVEFVHAPVQRVDDTIDASDERQEGLALLTVIVNRGQFTGPANALADAIAAHFPTGLRLLMSNGDDVMIAKPADVLQGFTDGIYWRVPVRLTYRTAAGLPAVFSTEFSEEFA